MDKNIMLKAISFLFFYLPLIISIILILMGSISFFRQNEEFFKSLIAGFTGVVAFIISSLVIKIIPNSCLIDTVGLWIVKFLIVFLILFAIGDTYEGKTNGIKALICCLIFVFIITLIRKIAM